MVCRFDTHKQEIKAGEKGRPHTLSNQHFLDLIEVKVSGDVPSPRAALAHVVVDKKILIFGGYSEN